MVAMKFITSFLALSTITTVLASPVPAKTDQSLNVKVEELDILTTADGKNYAVSSSGIIYLPYSTTPAPGTSRAPPKDLTILRGPDTPPDRDNLKPNDLQCEYRGVHVLVRGIYSHIDDVCWRLDRTYLLPKKIWKATYTLNGRTMEWFVNSYKWAFMYTFDDCQPEMRQVQHICANNNSQGKYWEDRIFYGGYKVSANGNLLTVVETSN